MPSPLGTRLPLPLLTRRLVLRELREEGLAALLAIESRTEVARYLPWEPRSGEAVERWLRARLAGVPPEEPGWAVHLALELRQDSRVIGYVLLRHQQPEQRQGKIGFVLHPEFHSLGLAREACAAMLDLGFRQLRLHRIYGRCDARNEASWRLMGRLGMRQEAHLVENEWVKGEWSDEMVWAILDREWRGLSKTPRTSATRPSTATGTESPRGPRPASRGRPASSPAS